MADLLTHVLVPYALLTVAGWRVTWFDRRWVAVGMAGAAIPDLVKVGIVVEAETVASILGLPFSFQPLSTLGGVLAMAAVIATFFERKPKLAYVLLVFGGLSALVLDGLRVFADGRAGFWLYPFTWWRPPTPSLYVTSDPRVLLVAVAVAVVVALLDRYRDDEGPNDAA